MNAAVRVFYNTAALYIKMFFTTILSLYLTRVVLNVLGVEDFGIYSLIAGIIAILSFLNSALMSSSQRFMSVAIGRADRQLVKTYFTSSLIVHICFALILLLMLELCTVFLFDGFLNIPDNRLHVAKQVYQLMILSMLVTVIGVPYNAVINANEDLWFFAIVEVVCAFLKLVVILLFNVVSADALLLYTAWMVFVTCINVFVKYLWCKYQYTECKNVKIFECPRSSIVDILGFSSWNALGAFAMVGRNQGVAVILNIFFGPAINAVYGIANQVNGQLIYFSQMLTTSMAPQIMKSKGEGNTHRMISLSVFTSKAAFMLSAIFAIPLTIEMPFVLQVWLGNVPPYTVKFCELVLYVFLIMQLYPGLTRAIQANGDIKLYQIYVSILLLLPLLIGCVLFKFQYPSYYICYAMIIAQFLTLLVTLALSKKLLNFNILPFAIYVIKAVLLYFTVLLFGQYLHKYLIGFMPQLHVFIIITLVTVVAFMSIYFLLVLNKEERSRIYNMLKGLIHK